MRQKVFNNKFILLATVFALCLAVLSCFIGYNAIPAKAETTDGDVMIIDEGDEGETTEPTDPETPPATAEVKIVDESGADYHIANRTFGDESAFPVPKLSEGDVTAENYGKEADQIELTLKLNNSTVGAKFTRGATKRDADGNVTQPGFEYYINESMPAGNYELTVTAKDGSVAEAKYNFTVNEKPLTAAFIEVYNALTAGKPNGNTFANDWDPDQQTHTLYNEATAQRIEDAIKNNVVNTAPEGVWTGERFDNLFGEVEILFNLSGGGDDLYKPASEIDIHNFGLYTVFYKLNAPNFLDTADNPQPGETRTDYKFRVATVQKVRIPNIPAKPYNGEEQTASFDGYEGMYYNVVTNNGGVEAGVYDVVLSLRNPTYQIWEDQDVEEWLEAQNSTEEEANDFATITTEFVIEKATNVWSETPYVAAWVQGKYDGETNAVLGKAAFGTAVIRITDIDGKKEYYNSATGVNKLKDAKSGMYTLTATVEETDNYTDITPFTYNFRIIRKLGVPVWGTVLIIIGALAVAAIIILILWRVGVFTVITDKILLSIRTRASVDATIAAVRANKRAEEVRNNQARAAADERARIRREAAEAEANMTPEELAASLKEKAKQTSERAKKMQEKAREMRNRANEVAAAAQAEAQNSEAVGEEAATEATDGNGTTEE